VLDKALDNIIISLIQLLYVKINALIDINFIGGRMFLGSTKMDIYTYTKYEA